MGERVVSNVALAVAFFDASDCLLDDLKEIAFALGALVLRGTFGATLDGTLHAHVVLEVESIDTLRATEVATGALYAIGKQLTALNLVVLVEVEPEGLLDAAGPLKLVDLLQATRFVRARQRQQI